MHLMVRKERLSGWYWILMVVYKYVYKLITLQPNYLCDTMKYLRLQGYQLSINWICQTLFFPFLHHQDINSAKKII